LKTSAENKKLLQALKNVEAPASIFNFVATKLEEHKNQNMAEDECLVWLGSFRSKCGQLLDGLRSSLGVTADDHKTLSFAIDSNEARALWAVYFDASTVPVSRVVAVLMGELRVTHEYFLPDDFATMLHIVMGKGSASTLSPVEFGTFYMRYGPFKMLPRKVSEMFQNTSPPSLQPWFLKELGERPWGIRYSGTSPRFIWMKKDVKHGYEIEHFPIASGGYQLRYGNFKSKYGSVPALLRAQCQSNKICQPSEVTTFNWSETIFVQNVPYERDVVEATPHRKDDFVDMTCIICAENQRDVLFATCRHMVCCKKCTTVLMSSPGARCPICREHLDEDDVLTDIII